MVERSNLEVWKARVARLKLPDWGHWLIAPSEEPDEYVLVHGETMTQIPLQRSEPGPWSEEVEFWKQVFPKAQVSAPTGIDDAGGA